MQRRGKEENALFVGSDKLVHDCAGNTDARDHGRQRERKPPGPYVGEDHAAHECRDVADHDGDLF